MSDPKILLGKAGMIEQPKRLIGGLLRPTQLFRSWRGPKDAAYAMINSLRLFDWTYEEDGPNATLTATTPDVSAAGGEQPVDTWELMPNVVEKDILDSQVEAVVLMGEERRRLVKAAIDANTTLTLKPFTNGTEQAANILATAIYNLMRKGQRSVRVVAPVLKRTRTVSSFYSTAQAISNVGRIYRNSSLISAEAIPSTFLISLNSAPFTNADPSVSSGESALLYGWWKGSPGQQIGSNSRVQVTQEWEFGLWPQAVYLEPI